MRRVALLGLMLCACGAPAPLAPTAVEKPVRVGVTCPTDAAVRVVKAPPFGATLRAGQTVDIVIEYSVPFTGYPHSVDVGLLWPRKMGGSGGLACGDRHHDQYVPVDRYECTLRLDKQALESDYQGIVPGGTVDISFLVFNWPDEHNVCSLSIFKRFPMGYRYAPEP